MSGQSNESIPKLYDITNQLKALAFILRHTPDELPMEAHHAYGLGCLLDSIAHNIEDLDKER